ncbi:hypothetical protein EMWEY_00059990, partial [Eimeria maxima]
LAASVPAGVEFVIAPDLKAAAVNRCGPVEQLDSCKVL